LEAVIGDTSHRPSLDDLLAGKGLIATAIVDASGMAYASLMYHAVVQERLDVSVEYPASDSDALARTLVVCAGYQTSL
jgi:hypothetical protein